MVILFNPFPILCRFDHTYYLNILKNLHYIKLDMKELIKLVNNLKKW
jgi:hypothetical protein